MQFSEDFRAHPYWWDDMPTATGESDALPKRAEVLVIGGGYTGMSAALHLARHGAEVVVLDSEATGWGCSSRNGGQISDGVKPSFAELARAHGATQARAIIEEAERALFWLGEFIDTENIQCDFRRCGRFHAAHTPSAYERMAREVEERNRPGGFPAVHANSAYLVERAEQSNEIGTQAYYGGAVFPEHVSAHPAKLHNGIETLALQAGATVIPHCAAEEIERDGDGFQVKTTKGVIACRHVVLATNGYSGKLSAWHHRRIIPIGSYIIATEPLKDGTLERLLPKDRVYSDSREVIYYYRASPDRRRMLFGGRVSCGETDPLISAPLLHKEMSRLFPELKNVRVSHSWCGFVAFTFDKLMHVGKREGIYYAMGYCGSGVALSIYLGMRVAQQLLGDKEGHTAFDNLPFKTAPFYTGSPWFLSALLAYYKWRDARA